MTEQLSSQSVSKMEKSLKLLNARKQSLFQRLQIAHDQSSFKNDNSAADLKAKNAFKIRCISLDETKSQYEKIIDEINFCKIELGEEPNFSELNSFDTMYCTLKEKLNCLIKSERKLSPEAGSSGTSKLPPTLSKPTLPPLEVPHFDGDELKWPFFHRIFKSVIVDNPELSTDDKVRFLSGVLSDKALALVSGIIPTGDNFDSMWKTLCNRYADPRVLATNYISKILNVKPTYKESSNSIDLFLQNFIAPAQAFLNLKLKDPVNFLLYYLAASRLPSSTIRQFELSLNLTNSSNAEESRDIPGFKELSSFLQNYVKILSHSSGSNVSPNNPSTSLTSPRTWNRPRSRDAPHISKSYVTARSAPTTRSTPTFNPAPIRTSFTFNSAPTNNYPNKISAPTSLNKRCPVCLESDHQIYMCDDFKNLSIKDRISAALKYKLCYNCLSFQHMTSTCRSKSVCSKCHQRHHTLLHDVKDQNPAPSNRVQPAISAVSASPFVSYTPSIILLSTAQVLVYDKLGKTHICRALLDSASQSNFMTKTLCDRLGLSTRPITTTIQGIGTISRSINNETSVQFSSRFDLNSHYKLNVLIIDKITDKLPSAKVSSKSLTHLQDLPLADESYNTPGSIDLLIGASLFPTLLKSGKVSGPHNTPHALQTSLGYVVIGPVEELTPPPDSLSEQLTEYLSMCNVSTQSLDKLVTQMWELDDLSTAQCSSAESEECERIYKETTIRTSDGRYSVNLPFIKEPALLGNSREKALSRFYSLEKQLKYNPNLRLEYNNFMLDYLAQGHMTLGENETDGCYLPHHCVFKPDSTSTKLRVVWDASCTTTSGYSINDLLYTGPKLHTNLIHILMNFRRYAVTMTADIRQMYRQIYINEDHKKYQKILWRFSESERIQVYTLNTVTFGFKPAPYLALRSLHKLANDSQTAYPIASSIIKKDFYIDDLVRSTPNVECAIQEHKQLVDLLHSGGFDLVKWNSNSQEFINFVSPEIRLNQNISFDSSNSTKILGLQYNAASDCFYFKVDPENKICTKRNILSSFARIFDPLGFLAPVTVSIKILIKNFWTLGLEWDWEVPKSSKLNYTWKTLQSQLSLLSQVQIPRYIGLEPDIDVDLVGFCDASAVAYGAVVYSRVTIAQTVIVCLLCSKTRVSPQKSVTIPRLELCAAVLLSKLLNSIFHNTRINIRHIYAMSDASVVLSWIATSPSRLQVFVANRVQQINTLVPNAKWYHVPGTCNPADCLSRGITPKTFLNNSLWVQGPEWILLDPQLWPISTYSSGGEEAIQTNLLTLVVTGFTDDPLNKLIERCSSYDTIIRVIARCRRWLTYKRNVSPSPFISALELNQSEIGLFKFIQREYFSKEMFSVLNNTKSSPRFRELQPFQDKHGLFLVGGRLTHSKISYQQKHQILLPKDSRLVHLLVDKYHCTYYHTGASTTLALLRQRFWIFGARDLIRKRIHACNICFKHKPRSTFPLMGNLPKERVTECKPFLHTGVDYAGPYHIVYSKRRGVRTHKAYMCLFICMSTKAVHLELASDLSTPTFLNALKRFISRRGPVHCFYSDGGTNFKGAHNYLNNVYELLSSKDHILAFGNELASHRIHWKQQVPFAPHMSGAWESNIKSAKTHLSKIIGNQILTYEELATLFSQVEALLNSRPLCVLSSDPHDPVSLTPAHFLSTQPLGHFPSLDWQDKPMNRLDRHQMLEKMTQDFWKRWHLEYLNTLQCREKWNTRSKPIKIGTVVVIRMDSCSPLHWPLGVVEAIHPGQDGVVRVVTVRCKDRLYRRPVVKLCPLPTQ